MSEVFPFAFMGAGSQRYRGGGIGYGGGLGRDVAHCHEQIEGWRADPQRWTPSVWVITHRESGEVVFRSTDDRVLTHGVLGLWLEALDAGVQFEELDWVADAVGKLRVRA